MLKRHELSAAEYHEPTILAFLDFLKSDTRIVDWQYRQASDALRLYYFNYLGKAGVLRKYCFEEKTVGNIRYRLTLMPPTS